MSFVDTNFMCEFWMFLLKTDFLIHNFWIVYTEVKMGSIGICILFCFIWDPTLLYLDKTVFTRYPYIKIRLYIKIRCLRTLVLRFLKENSCLQRIHYLGKNSFYGEIWLGKREKVLQWKIISRFVNLKWRNDVNLSRKCNYNNLIVSWYSITLNIGGCCSSCLYYLKYMSPLKYQTV